MSRVVKLALAVGLLVLASLVIPSRAQAENYKLNATASPASVELFGTSFCIVDSRLSTGCRALSLPEVRFTVVNHELHARRWKVFGITVCAAPDSLGPACDVVWISPIPSVAWRDQPEIRTLDLLHR